MRLAVLVILACVLDHFQIDLLEPHWIFIVAAVIAVTQDAAELYFHLK